MPLEHILRAMQAQAESEIQNITRAAESETAQLIAEAETEAKAIRAVTVNGRPHTGFDPVDSTVRLPAATEALGQLGFEWEPNSPEQFASYIQSETAKWAEIVKSTNTQVE